MNNHFQELTEKKLLILYILKKLGFPATNLQLLRIAAEYKFMNYFELQEYIVELADCAFIDLHKKAYGDVYSIMPSGIDALEHFHKRIRLSFRLQIDDFIQSNAEKMKSEKQLITRIKENMPNEYMAECLIIENDSPLLTLSFNVPTISQAELMLGNWEENASEIYCYLIDKLSQ
ncbi:MAG: DUF4364 family protein [Christensenellales bacterium]